MQTELFLKESQRKSKFKAFLRPFLGPLAIRVRAIFYRFHFNLRLKSLRASLRYSSRSIAAIQDGVTPEASQAAIWSKIDLTYPSNIRRLILSVDPLTSNWGGKAYWDRYRPFYDGIGNGQEKALEHSLLFSLLDLNRAQTFCDIAAAQSPIQNFLHHQFPHCEYWKQDLLYQTDLQNKTVGGFAQKMTEIGAGFFDALFLSCSFEHFWNQGDREFMQEVDRLLSPHGACLIVPLYLDLTPKIFFDPTFVRPETIAQFDSDTALVPAFAFRQDHARYYSPESLYLRLLKDLPAGLHATLLSFVDQPQGIYLKFGLVLHRKDSLLKGDLT